MTDLFLFLERANFLIFYDAWHHVLLHLLGRGHAESRPPRVSRFMSEAWLAYESDGAASERERQLVRDLVTNEQNFIERRVVHHARFSRAAAIVGFIESIGRQAPVLLPDRTCVEVVDAFASLETRIATGWRIYDRVLADRAERERLYHWAVAHPHTGSRATYGGRKTPSVREAWPVAKARARWHAIHAPAELDSEW
jgi:hypothetical protein